MSAVVIQKTWRSYRCRKKVKQFSQLPPDVWAIIVSYCRACPQLYHNINRVLSLRLTLLFWSLPSSRIKQKIQTLTLVKKYYHILNYDVKARAFQMSLRLLNYSKSFSPQARLMLNSVIEFMQDSETLLGSRFH